MAIRSIEQVEMNQVRLECPVADEAIADLKLGDLVYLDGLIYTGREGLYRRMLDEGIEPPVPLDQVSNVNFHCSPAASAAGGGGYIVKAVSATASFRFGKWMKAFFERTHARMIIGKGGMTSREYRSLFVPARALYLTTVGYGLGAIYGRGVTGVRNVYWLEELGVAQAQLAEIREGVQMAGCPGDPAYNLAWADILNMENYLDVSDAIVNGALVRKESRGSHYRSDFPERDDSAYLCNFIFTKDSQTPVSREVVMTRMKPEAVESAT